MPGTVLISLQTSDSFLLYQLNFYLSISEEQRNKVIGTGSHGCYIENPLLKFSLILGPAAKYGLLLSCFMPPISNDCVGHFLKFHLLWPDLGI